MTAPSWMKPEGISAVRAAQIDRDWNRRQHAARFSSEPTQPRECDPTYTLDRYIAELHRDTPPERLAALYAEWTAPYLVESDHGCK